MNRDRRKFALLAGGLGLATLTPALGGTPEPSKPPADDDISATEDLMREHGLLNRTLLCL
jgi:hypothetical protein